MLTAQPLTDTDRRRVGMLIHSALDQLWYASPDSAGDNADPLDHLGCCPTCCAPCSVLAELLADGTLDEQVRWWPDMLPGSAWWDDERGEVDRGWLERAWAGSKDGRLGCACEVEDE